MTEPTDPTTSPHPDPQHEAVRICRELIRIDSSNYGDGSGPGERAAAEYVMSELTEVGYDPVLLESAPGRANVFLRIEGTDPGRGALVLHGHTDVVPAEASDWKMDPFGGDEMDGLIWGRGAVDMKDMDAMMLAVLRDMARTGRKPPRDLVVAFFADEEAGGRFGSHWAVDHHPEFFEGATEAVSEVGGFSVEVGGQRAYLLQTAEKGIAWTKLIADGVAQHGSQVSVDNAVARLAGAIARIGAHRWPRSITPTVHQLLQGVADLTGTAWDPTDPQGTDRLVAALGSAAKFVGATLSTTANPTQLDAGYKANVVPGQASGVIDVRYLPGGKDATMATLRELAGEGITFESVSEDIALEAPFGTDLTDAMTAAIRAEDPEAAVLPYMLSGGTDNKALKGLGIEGYGFAPLRLPADLDFAGMFHGVDERVPVDSVHFGVRVLDRLLRTM
ncbi:M20/M25/M40 family metallo-hydrolase [Serinibacter salmoneus]|uniref:Acetylornithine deacetylase/succinyl-diaminopimelate desuccinylase-like protein n=1 Tax=Serinibacter salmoneus TaxID=556530 RepID=A0A2A9CZC9_9MICO|nr:M20/M25/M40 family metallo-hydrolase [Serinibacter salmoneus]PFG19784.1 acetylornithine deacetylase/succinyl-diaminopimelate desuccinylase-like protein [Serinibacter salmoneus]